LKQPIFIIREQRMERFGEHRRFNKFHQSMVRQWRTKGYGFWLKATVNGASDGSVHKSTERIKRVIAHIK
jgi:hypothetical protein